MKNARGSWGKKKVIYKKTAIQLSVDFSAETIGQVRMK